MTRLQPQFTVASCGNSTDLCAAANDRVMTRADISVEICSFPAGIRHVLRYACGAWSSQDDPMTSDMQLTGPDAWRRPAAAIGVVLLERHDLMRRSLRRLFDSEIDINIVCEATDIAGARRAVHARGAQILIIDPLTEAGLALATIRELHREEPRIPIVVIAMEPSPVFADATFAAGAIGYVLKDHADTDLVDAVRGAARGQQYLSPAISGQSAGRRRRSHDLRSPQRRESATAVGARPARVPPVSRAPTSASASSRRGAGRPI